MAIVNTAFALDRWTYPETATFGLPAPQAGEVRIRIAGMGLCVDEVAGLEGRATAALFDGHGCECSGIVDAVGEGVSRVRPGDAVVLSFGFCGICANCQRARYGYCLQQEPTIRVAASGRPTVPGNHLIVAERRVVRIPPDVPVELMGPLGHSMLSGAGAVINALKPAPGSSIAIFGLDAVGMAALMAAKALGAGVIFAVDLQSERLRMAESLGATHVMHADEIDVAKEIHAITAHGVQYAVECIGSEHLLLMAVRSLGTTGVCAMLGASRDDRQVGLLINFMLTGRTLRGVQKGEAIPDLFIPELIELWRQERFPFDRLVRFYNMSDIDKAVAAVRQGRLLKPIMRPTLW